MTSNNNQRNLNFVTQSLEPVPLCKCLKAPKYLEGDFCNNVVIINRDGSTQPYCLYHLRNKDVYEDREKAARVAREVKKKFEENKLKRKRAELEFDGETTELTLFILEETEVAERASKKAKVLGPLAKEAERAEIKRKKAVKKEKEVDETLIRVRRLRRRNNNSESEEEEEEEGSDEAEKSPESQQ